MSENKIDKLYFLKKGQKRSGTEEGNQIMKNVNH